MTITFTATIELDLPDGEIVPEMFKPHLKVEIEDAVSRVLDMAYDDGIKGKTFTVRI